MEESGYSPEVQLAFDRSCLTLVQRYRRMKEQTKLEPVPAEERRRKQIPKRTVPLHSPEELLRFLGVHDAIEDDDKITEVLGVLDAEMWNSVDWETQEDPE
jgi:hypothetical protein